LAQKSAVAEENNFSHMFLLNNTRSLAYKSRCRDQMIRNKAEIEQYPNNINWEDGFSLNRSWKSLIQCPTRKMAAGGLLHI
jgi:hypothetical protein